MGSDTIELKFIENIEGQYDELFEIEPDTIKF